MYNLADMLRDEDVIRRLADHVAGGPPAGLLRSVKIKIISTCNLRCRMCKYWRIPPRALPREVVLRALDDAATLGCAKVHFSGGEVTLHPDLDPFIARAAGLAMRVSLTTNGVLVDKDRARAWVGAGLRNASFSLEASKPEAHDEIRGVPGAFRRTVRGIRTLRREIDRRHAKTGIHVNNVLLRENLADHARLVRLAGELGAGDVVPMPVDGDGVERPTAEEIRRFNEDVVPKVAELRRQYGMPLNSGRLYPFGRTDEEIRLAAAGQYALGYYEDELCFAPHLHAFVSHQAEVYACCMTRGKTPPLGNVIDQSLAEIFVSPEYERLRRSMRRERLEPCARCDMFLKENRLVRDRLAMRHPPQPAPYALEVVA